MLLRGEVDLPDDLEMARSQGNLVVFVGAGFSVDPPSGLPSFPTLVEKVANAAGEPMAVEPERLDQQLGELESIPGFSVHGAIRDLLSPPGSEPNKRHEAVIGLFEGANAIRVVTTNYDEHLEAAARTLLREEVPVWSAPALPIGSDFRGIVHLHGSVSNDDSLLVATDVDFSRAYLTQGWARRFLVELFTSYTVLFVGYSHNDVVMRYLARGLPVGTSRFILTSSRQAGDPQWQSMGLTSLGYASTSDDDHAGSLIALQHWVEWSHMSFLTRRERIRNIVESGTNLDRFDESFIRSLFRNAAETTLFCELNEDPEWLTWMGRIDPFKQLFEVGTRGGEVHGVLANWFVQTFAFKHPEAALRAVVAEGKHISRPLWFAIARGLHSTRDLNSSIRNRWVAILVNAIPPDQLVDYLDYIAENSSRLEDEAALFVLLDELLDPSTELKPGFGISPMRVDVIVRGDQFWLEKIAEEILRPRMGRLCRQIYRLGTGKLEKAHRLYALNDSATHQTDPISFTRAAVDADGQDQTSRSAIDVAIDLTRDSAAALSNPTQARVVIDDLMSFSAPILNRIGIWLVAETDDLTSDEKLEWLIEQGLLSEHTFRPEVYRVLGDAFGPAADQVKLALWETSNPDIDEYESFNLAVWLLRMDPGFEPAERFRVNAAASHGWEARDRPDLLWEMRVGWTEIDNQLAPIPPLAAIEEFTADPERWFDISQRVGSTTVRDPDVGFQLLTAMSEQDLVIEPFWRAVLSAFIRAGTSREQVERVVSIAAHVPQPSVLLQSMAEYLDSAAEQGSVEDLDLRRTASEALLTSLTAAIDAATVSVDIGTPDDPLTSAINSWPGRCADFLVRVTRGDDGPEPCTLTGLDRFTLLVEEHKTESWAQLAMSALGRAFYYILSVCPEIADQVVAHWFSWTVPDTAFHAWSGYAYGRVTQKTVAAQTPHLRALAEHLERFEGMAMDGLIERLALMATHSNVIPEWLPVLIAANPDEVRANFAYALGRFLRESIEEGTRPQVTEWMRTYWSNRLNGLPRVIEPLEGEAIMRWGFYRTDAVDDEPLLDLMTRTPLGTGVSHGLLWDLERSPLWTIDKTAGVRVLTKILESRLELHDTAVIDRLLTEARDRGIADELLEAACEAVARRGMAPHINVCNQN